MKMENQLYSQISFSAFFARLDSGDFSQACWQNELLYETITILLV